ncbi:hypothetical protein ABH892_002075 [Paenibacillus sp. RC254]
MNDRLRLVESTVKYSRRRTFLRAIILLTTEWLRWRSAKSPGREVMPVEVKDALTLMMMFGTLLVALIGLIVTIVIALNQNKKE